MELATAGAVAVSAIAAATDLGSGTIPNRLTYPAIAGGLALGAWPGVAPAAGASALGLLVAFVPAFALFTLGSVGGGDVKLLAAVGALLGYPAVVEVLVLSVVAGTALALVTLAARGQLLPLLVGAGRFVWMRARGMPAPPPSSGLHVPFAVAVLVATLWALVVPAGAGVLGLPGAA